MRRLPTGKRRLIALVCTLLVVSVLYGDMSVGQARTTAAVQPTIAPRVPGRGADAVAPNNHAVTATCSVLEDAYWGGSPLDATSRSMVGVPPWIEFPASPMPRFGGPLFRPPVARFRSIDSVVLAPGLCASDPASGFWPARAGVSPGWPEPFQPLDRLAGVHHRFPRPPPL
jgi:hypothetical protein